MFSFDQPYCLIHAEGKTRLAVGEIHRVKLLAEVPRPTEHPIISVVPYSQLRERGFLVHDEGEPIITLAPAEYHEVDLDEVASRGIVPEFRLASEPRFNVDDAEFADQVRRIIADEIQQGEGSNFLLSRKCFVQIGDFSPHVANIIFARLAHEELGAYLTFCFFDGERFFIGSSPERHITIRHNQVLMNPICGTLPKAALTKRADLVEFLSDPKEINELFQVVDEELKMMSRICGEGGIVHGPYLKEMSSLIHTEYILQGATTMDPIDAFRESMFAATMIGSPLQNAARIIHRYESDPRRYYSSALMILGLGDDGAEHLDSAITIRTMEVTPDGDAVIQAGASIVRDSRPEKECQEVTAKAAGLLRAISSGAHAEPVLPAYTDRLVNDVLHARNKHLSRFWIERQSPTRGGGEFAGRSISVVDNEDEFTHMLKHLLQHLGFRTEVRTWDDPGLDLSTADLVLIGPGPGNPANLADPKMHRVHELVRDLLDRKAKFLAVCLGHQILSLQLGMSIIASDPPLQGVQQSIDLFGRQEPVGFYNTFFAARPDSPPPGVKLSTDAEGRVMALRAADFASFQFHVESVLTTNSRLILREALSWLTP